MFLIGLLTVTGCGEPDVAIFVVQEARLSPDTLLHAPTQDVVLTITGRIQKKNVGESLQLDIATLEQMRLVQYTVADPWLHSDVTYTGVLLSDLLLTIQPESGVTSLSVRALDGSRADIPIRLIEQSNAMLATRADGRHMLVEESGPTRIVFAYDSVNDIDQARQLSVWNLEQIEVR